MQRSVRIPLAWLDADESVVFQLGHVPAPQENKEPYLERWARARATVALRPAYGGAVLYEALPPALDGRVQALSARLDFKQAMQGLNWTIRLINLAEVLAYQKQIVLEQIEDRVKGCTAEDLDTLFSVAFPDEKVEDLSATMDYSSRATTFTSLNPNLNVAFQGAADVVISHVPGEPKKANKMFGFIVSVRPSFIQAVEYHGRLFIRDGYHRCFGLLQRGITRVPAIVVQARVFQQVGCQGGGFLKEDLLLGERPLFLRDMLDDNVSATAQQPVTRKVIRIKAEEYTLQV